MTSKEIFKSNEVKLRRPDIVDRMGEDAGKYDISQTSQAFVKPDGVLGCGRKLSTTQKQFNVRFQAMTLKLKILFFEVCEN